MIVVQALRSALFYLLYLGQTIILALLIGTIAILTGRRRIAFNWWLGLYWGASNRFLLRYLVGIRTDVSGEANIPPGGCIIAAKHQSDWDIFAILPHTRRPAFIAKKELMDIPFFGWAAASLDTIAVDRKKGGDAIPAMMRDARAALDRGCRIVIFPEGTRVAPLAPPDYRYGIARMYQELDVPVVPVALDSGLYWGRNGLILWPGTARARFLEPIAPGLAPDVFIAELRQRIETETNRLILEAVDAGISRLLTPDFQARVDAARNH